MRNMAVVMAMVCLLCSVAQFHHHDREGHIHLIDSCTADCVPEPGCCHSHGHDCDGDADGCCTLQLSAQESPRAFSLEDYITDNLSCPSEGIPDTTSFDFTAADEEQARERELRCAVPSPLGLRPNPLRAPPCVA